MSEQAQLFLLQRRLNEIKNYKRYALILGITFSIVLALIWPFDFFIGLFLAMFVGTAIVWGVEWHYRKEEFRILQMIQKMAISIPKCPKCGKEIPQGNFDFCPFCGNSLKT